MFFAVADFREVDHAVSILRLHSVFFSVRLRQAEILLTGQPENPTPPVKEVLRRLSIKNPHCTRMCGTHREIIPPPCEIAKGLFEPECAVAYLLDESRCLKRNIRGKLGCGFEGCNGLRALTHAIVRGRKREISLYLLRM